MTARRRLVSGPDAPLCGVLRSMVLIACCLACGSDDAPDPMAPGSGGASARDIPYEPCAAEDSLGGFTVELADEFTQVAGQVFDGVEPSSVPVELAADDECRLFVPPSLFCDPLCAYATETCGTDLTCVPLPQAVDLGTVRVTGLAIPMQMQPSMRTRSYSNPARPELPHPGFEAGADLRLTTGDGDYPAFELRGWGVSPLELSGAIAVDPGQPSVLSWQAPDDPGPARVVVNLDINVHGAGSARIECDFADTGSAEISAALIDALIAQGLSGFPTAIVTRRTVTSTDVGPGCVDFTVAASIDARVDVAGIRSCNVDDDCLPEGGTCVPILRNCE